MIETLHCYQCDKDFTRERKRGVKPLRCNPCRTPKRPRRAAADREDTRTPGERLAGSVTKYRLAIEIALPAIKLGKYDEAVKALEGATR